MRREAHERARSARVAARTRVLPRTNHASAVAAEATRRFLGGAAPAAPPVCMLPRRAPAGRCVYTCSVGSGGARRARERAPRDAAAPARGTTAQAYLPHGATLRWPTGVAEQPARAVRHGGINCALNLAHGPHRGEAGRGGVEAQERRGDSHGGQAPAPRAPLTRVACCGPVHPASTASRNSPLAHSPQPVGGRGRLARRSAQVGVHRAYGQQSCRPGCRKCGATATSHRQEEIF